MKLLPFRLRVTVWSLLVVTVSLIVCGIVAALVIHHGEMEELDEELQGESDHFYNELNRHGGARFDWRRIDGVDRFDYVWIQIRPGGEVPLSPTEKPGEPRVWMKWVKAPTPEAPAPREKAPATPPKS